MKINIGVDFGGSFVSICKKGEGIVFKEPSLISVKGGNSNYEITAVGNEAKKNQNQILEDILVFAPLSEGIIKSIDYAVYYLNYALSKTFKNVPFRKFSILMAVPCGISPEEEEKYNLICKKTGIRKSKMVKGVFCSYSAQDIFLADGILCPKNQSNVSAHKNVGPKMIIDVGGAKTDVAVIDNGTLLIGTTLGIGGNAIDNSIINEVEKKYKIGIDESIAETIKNNIGSLYQNDTLTIEIVGLDIESQSPRNCIIYSKDIRTCLLPYFMEIAKVVKATLAELPQSIAEKIIRNRALLTGGVMGISGVERFLSKEVGIKCEISENNENSVILGLLKNL
ncbi:MAG: rod shape-determining protein [Clostridia bacterium]|jgi:rod shape-determining protein MreB|nr:rod shape-determining protein [Clostridia bacterium]